MIALLLACREEPAGPEPLELPADLAATGVPVGVRTVEVGRYTVEVWYPAPESARGSPGEAVDFSGFVPADVVDALGPVDLPTIPTIAVRDAPVRDAGEPYPAVIFSHGFGGTRLQSVDLTTHLASRGYVVVATDHAGRSMPDLLPCLFSPPLDGCSLSFDDPAVDDVEALADWIEDPPAWLAGRVDPSELALMGHSAGGGTTVTAGASHDRFRALIPMAGGDALSREVPTLRMAGSCDGIVPADGLHDAFLAGPPSERWVAVQGAGHLAFSDLCDLELGRIGEDLLAGRDDVNPILLDQLLALGTDGCPGSAPAPGLCEADAYLGLAVSAEIVRWYTTAELDEVLYGSGSVPDDPPFAEVVYEPGPT